MCKVYIRAKKIATATVLSGHFTEQLILLVIMHSGVGLAGRFTAGHIACYNINTIAFCMIKGADSSIIIYAIRITKYKAKC